MKLFGRTVLTGFLLAIWTTCFAAEEAGLTEVRVKAAFLYKFASYVEWPDGVFAQEDSPITIAVLGSERVAAELTQTIANRKVNDRAVIVKRLKPGESLSGVHILFVSHGATAQLRALTQMARSMSVLTVTESDGALAQGSVINFVVADQRVRFEISRDSANKSKLRLGSGLLAVALHVAALNGAKILSGSTVNV